MAAKLRIKYPPAAINKLKNTIGSIYSRRMARYRNRRSLFNLNGCSPCNFCNCCGDIPPTPTCPCATDICFSLTATDNACTCGTLFDGTPTTIFWTEFDEESGLCIWAKSADVLTCNFGTASRDYTLTYDPVTGIWDWTFGNEVHYTGMGVTDCTGVFSQTLTKVPTGSTLCTWPDTMELLNCPGIDCCPGTAIPYTLYATITIVSGTCTCLIGDAVTLTYDSGNDWWYGEGPDRCGFANCKSKLKLTCDPDAGTWTLDFGGSCCFVYTIETPTSTSCDPFELHFYNEGLSAPQCCLTLAPLDITITD